MLFRPVVLASFAKTSRGSPVVFLGGVGAQEGG